LQAELPHKAVSQLCIRWRRGRSGNQAAQVAAAKCRRGKTLGCFAVGFSLQGRNSLPFHLVFESVDEVLFGKAAGRSDLIAQAIAPRAVVLAMGQPPYGWSLQSAVLDPGDLVVGLTHLIVRETGQVLNPVLERLLFVAAGLDPLAPRVFHTPGWLL